MIANNHSDTFFERAEQLATDFSLLKEVTPASHDKTRQALEGALKGLVSTDAISKKLEELKNLEVDDYIKQTVEPSEKKNRISFKALLKQLKLPIFEEFAVGSLHCVETEFDFGNKKRRVCLLGQERSSNNGVWKPEHHREAIRLIRRYVQYSMPIVTFIDTPGADAGEEANSDNQAHSISHLIAEMANVDVPTVGIILGNGYSGGAIPLATTNILLSVRDGVFSTIQPKGLASIARKYDLSWQECAKYVGVSAFELYSQDYIDGIIDYTPGDKGPELENLRDAIVSSILTIEQKAYLFVKKTDGIVDHYLSSLARYLDPSEKLQSLQKHSELCLAQHPTEYPNIFGITYRYLRYLSLRGRIRSTVKSNFSLTSDLVTPKGDLTKRVQEEFENAFSNWKDNPEQIRYYDTLSKSFKLFLDRKEHVGDQRGRITKLIFGDPEKNYFQARSEVYFAYGFHLYNQWKSGAQNNFLALIDLLINSEEPSEEKDPSQMILMDVLLNPDLKEGFIRECKNLIIFDIVYDQIINDLRPIAKEAKDYNTISRDSVHKLLEAAMNNAVNRLSGLLEEDTDQADLKKTFFDWLQYLLKQSKKSDFIRPVQEWKKIQHPRISEPLFAVVTYFFEKILEEYCDSELDGTQYDGQIKKISNIGMKDFWNRLTTAYQDLLIDDVLLNDKKSKNTRFETIIDRFFTDFHELDADLMTTDPVNFPGFRISIEQALQKNIKPCGVITGFAKLNAHKDHPATSVGVIISNLAFQAGAFDMASAQKFCNLLLHCAKNKLPVVSFISSGGMQTKEGAGSLFSMAIVNDRITRFVRDNDLPIVCFGFGDCTGGAQASFVTHPLVQTYYFSGTNMPFAGQIVVPSYLSSASTLSNYLSEKEGAMQGLVKHPFNDEMDSKLKEVDPSIPTPVETVEEACHRVFKGLYVPEFDIAAATEVIDTTDRCNITPVKKVLIHARGCTASKLIKIAQKNNIEIVLVQSDADMDSVVAEQLTEKDTLVCIGGNTPDESYLNAKSVLRVAEQEKVDSIHPGIGFLSENADFAHMVRNRGFNFIGPWVSSMELMGNKSNAINTATKVKVPVVPGSHGIINDVKEGQEVAQKIGYPVLLKAVHGGGGKGIQVVEKPEDFRELFYTISSEARAAFGSGDIYLEKYVTNLRHVEIQVLRDTFGNTKILGLRDCSVQRNNQKIIEESTSTMLPPELEDAVYKYSESLVNEIDYVGAGTVEFIFDLDNNAVYFMEANTRLQVEHPVTEKVTGIDIVSNQFKIASGESIKDLTPAKNGYAVEARITAERTEVKNGEINFVPNPGEVTEFSFPTGDHIDVIRMVGEGKNITPYYDSLIAQVIITAETRDEAADLLIEWLSKTTIKGVQTNIPLLKRILRDEIFRKGDYNTQYLNGLLERIDVDEMIAEGEQASGTADAGLDRSAIEIEDSDEIKVISPSTGVFYDAPSPTEPAFAETGKRLKTTDTLCLLEAMKIFSSLTLDHFNKEDQKIYNPEKEFEVVQVIPASGTAVNKGDLLLILKEV